MIPGLTDLVDGLSNALNACEPPLSCSMFRPLTSPSKTCIRLSLHISQYALLTVPDSYDAHNQRLARAYTGHLCDWRGLLCCHLLRRPVGGNLEYYIHFSTLTSVSGIQRFECFGPNPQCSLQGVFDVQVGELGTYPHTGPLRYHPERARREGRKGCCRTLCKTYRRGLLRGNTILVSTDSKFESNRRLGQTTQIPMMSSTGYLRQAASEWCHANPLVDSRGVSSPLLQQRPL